ncbi:MAG: flippase-like domain-containing protein [Bacteroidales bacterium]|nr:flippase-like domain-containing protein [Bacteroidales bacterium]MBQ3576530.1 flippase-like domain-containing protein [Coprobacter sp.]
MKRITSYIFKFIIPLAFGVGLMWYIYSKLNMEEVGKILQYDINYWWIFLSGVIGLLSHIVRALRWKIQLKALPANPSMRVLTNAIFGTYAVNLILPRVGEVWRCAYVAQSEEKSFIKVVGSMISERLTDTLTVITITIVTLFLQLDVLKDILNENPSIKEGIVNIITSPALYSVIAVGIIALVWLFRFKSNNPLIIKVKELVNNLINGFKTIFQMEKKGLFLFYTVLMWFLYFIELYVCFFAFKQTESLGIVCAFSCFLMGSIGMGVPVQGGLGPWHWAVIAVLTLYGLNNDTAGAFALVAHGAQLIMTILIGIYTFVSISLYKKRGKEENNS